MDFAGENVVDGEALRERNVEPLKAGRSIQGDEPIANGNEGRSGRMGRDEQESDQNT
jgi:hypothetical protein